MLRRDHLEGHYARKQLLSPARIIAWSHGARFRTGVELVRSLHPRRVLDYGCGDGTFLAILSEGAGAPARAVGAEVATEFADDCRRRLGRAGLEFVTIDALDAPEHRGAYDAVVCMDVLEHVVDVDAVLARLEALLAPGGRVVVSVPVETGLPILVKETVRRALGWLRVGDYPGSTSYTASELCASVFAGRAQHVERPTHPTPRGPEYDHKGFNWRAFRAQLDARFDVERVSASPVRVLPPSLASQAWFVARRRAVKTASIG